MDELEIVGYLTRMSQSDQSIAFINQIDNELSIKGITHVSIECQLSYMLWNNGFEQQAIDRFTRIIESEINSGFSCYATPYADAVGMAISFLIENKIKKSGAEYKDLFRMGYVYLTKHIEMLGEQMCDSYKHRAYLIENSNHYAEYLGIEFLKALSFIPIPLAISDYYSAGKAYHSQGYNDRFQECIERGAYLHNWLEDMRINGKDADQYEFTEMAELGRQRLELLNSKITDFKIFDTNKIIELLGLDKSITDTSVEPKTNVPESSRVHEDDLEYDIDWENEIKTAYFKGQLFNGTSFSNYSDGSVKHEIPYSNGKKNGIEKSWYQNGSIKGESECRNGIGIGTAKGWHENGQIAYEWFWIEKNKPHGAWKTYYENGQLKKHKIYNRGTLTFEKEY